MVLGGIVQKMSHVINECPRIILSYGGLQRLHFSTQTWSSGWKERRSTKALAKWSEMKWYHLQYFWVTGDPYSPDTPAGQLIRWRSALCSIQLVNSWSRDGNHEFATCEWNAYFSEISNFVIMTSSLTEKYSITQSALQPNRHFY